MSLLENRFWSRGIRLSLMSPQTSPRYNSEQWSRPLRRALHHSRADYSMMRGAASGGRPEKQFIPLELRCNTQKHHVRTLTPPLWPLPAHSNSHAQLSTPTPGRQLALVNLQPRWRRHASSVMTPGVFTPCACLWITLLAHLHGVVIMLIA